jgi:hypothetical protein
MTFRTLSITLFAFVFAAGCSTNPDGSTTYGMIGSAMWRKTAPMEVKIAHFAPTCKALGFKEGTVSFSRCVQSEMNDDRRDARARASSAMSTDITCITYGNITDCY